jgi:hypothetical protein
LQRGADNNTLCLPFFLQQKRKINQTPATCNTLELFYTIVSPDCSISITIFHFSL